MIWKKKPRDDVKNGLQQLYPRLWRYALVLTANRDLADELAQATCLRAIEKSNQFAAGSQLDRWVLRIAQRLWLNELRARSVRQGGGMASIDEIDLPDNRPGPESNILTREVLLEVMALPEAQRVTVALVYAEGYSYQEAAKILDIPIGTVMSRLAAARAKLAGRFDTNKSSTG